MQVIFPCCCARFTMKHQHCFICSCLCLSLSSVCVSRSNLRLIYCAPLSISLPALSLFFCVLFVCLSYLPVLNADLSVSVCLCPSLSICIPLSLSNILSLSQWLPVFLLILRLCSSQYNFNSTFSLAPSFFYTILSNSLAISLPLSLVCRSYFHVAEWRRDLRCFELPQTVSLPPCLFMSLCICLIVSRCN